MIKKILLAISLIALQAQAAVIEKWSWSAQDPSDPEDIRILERNRLPERDFSISHFKDCSNWKPNETNRIDHVKFGDGGRNASDPIIYQADNVPASATFQELLVSLMGTPQNGIGYKFSKVNKELNLNVLVDPKDTLGSRGIDSSTPIIITFRQTYVAANVKAQSGNTADIARWNDRVLSGAKKVNKTTKSLAPLINLLLQTKSKSEVSRVITGHHKNARIYRDIVNGQARRPLIFFPNSQTGSQANRINGDILINYKGETYIAKRIPSDYKILDLIYILEGYFPVKFLGKYNVQKGGVTLKRSSTIASCNIVPGDQIDIIQTEASSATEG